MFKQYVKEDEIIMIIEQEHINKLSQITKHNSRYLLIPFLTKVYRQTKDMDLLEFLTHFKSFMLQLKEDKEKICSLIEEKSDTKYNCLLITSLKDLTAFALSLLLDESESSLVKKIINTYNLGD